MDLSKRKENMNKQENIQEQKKPTKIVMWENLQLGVLFGTILGQVLVGAFYFAAQSIWLTCNIIALARDIVLKRPMADKIKNASMAALTLGLIILRVMGVY